MESVEATSLKRMESRYVVRHNGWLHQRKTHIIAESESCIHDKNKIVSNNLKTSPTPCCEHRYRSDLCSMDAPALRVTGRRQATTKRQANSMNCSIETQRATLPPGIYILTITSEKSDTKRLAISESRATDDMLARTAQNVAMQCEPPTAPLGAHI